MVRAYQLGLRIEDLEEMEEGMVIDMMTEMGNDTAEYHELASQEDMDRF